MLDNLVNIARLTAFGQGVIDLLMGPINSNAEDISDLQDAVSNGVGTLSYDADTETIYFVSPSASNNNNS